MSARTFFGGLLSGFVLVIAACSDAKENSAADCGPGTCGACQDGFVNHDTCVDGEWKCECIATDASADDEESSDGGLDGSSPKAPPPVATCEEKLANVGEARSCVADDWDKTCTSGCLTCTCNAGIWGCTTSQGCFGDGG